MTASNDSQIRIWDINNGECLRLLFHNNEIVSSVSFGRNYMLTASEENRIILWNLDDFSVIVNFIFDSTA